MKHNESFLKSARFRLLGESEFNGKGYAIHLRTDVGIHTLDRFLFFSRFITIMHGRSMCISLFIKAKQDY